MEASRLAQEYNAQISEDAENEVLETLKAEGAIVVETEMAPWVEACQQVITDNTATQAELYQQILDLA